MHDACRLQRRGGVYLPSAIIRDQCRNDDYGDAYGRYRRKRYGGRRPNRLLRTPSSPFRHKREGEAIPIPILIRIPTPILPQTRIPIQSLIPTPILRPTPTDRYIAPAGSSCRSRTMPTATAATTRTRPTTMRIICAQATSRMHRTTARHAISAYVTAASTTVRYGSQHRVTNAIRARQTAPTHTAKTRRYRPIYSITASLRAEDATRDTWWVRPNALRRRRPTVRCSTTRT